MNGKRESVERGWDASVGSSYAGAGRDSVISTPRVQIPPLL